MESQPQKPNNYLAWAIVSTILCCLPFGIVSIVYAAKVDSLWITGQHEESIAASKKAKAWMQTAVISGAIFWLLYLFFIVIVTAWSQQFR